jgi:acetolactate synthase-1/2/3 large subunit
MNGAEGLARTLLKNGVNVCFANPGTSEMHFVAALDIVDGMRSVLCLFEGVASGAADGYYRMRETPAATLLHLGPGFGNAIANLHNAKKARSGIVNVVGEHATYHLVHDAPLSSDIETLAGPMSHWVKTSDRPENVGRDGAEAITKAREGQGRIATLLLPADVSWGEGAEICTAPAAAASPAPTADMVRTCASLLRGGSKAAMLLGGGALRGKALELAGRIAAKTGCLLLAEANNARHERGAGRVGVKRLPMLVSDARNTLGGVDNLLLVGAKPPVAFFAYPGQPSVLTDEQCRIETLANFDSDPGAALQALCDELDAHSVKPILLSRSKDVRPISGPLTPEQIEIALSSNLPENAIVVDESITTGRGFSSTIERSAPHDWMHSMGASLGYALPVAVGAAIAAPDRKVVALVGDGSALYTPQAMWTMVRENLDVTMLIFSNRAYQVLRGELSRMGARNPGPKALDMLSLDRPTIDWVGLAQAHGVEAGRADDFATLASEIQRGLASEGPYLIEVVL